MAHHGGTEAVLDGNVGAMYHAQRTYSNSKLANLLFALELQRQLRRAACRWSRWPPTPGSSATGLVADPQGMGANPVMRVAAPVFFKLFTQSAAAGARADAVRGHRGRAGFLHRAAAAA